MGHDGYFRTPAVRVEHIEVDGVRIAYRRAGTGPPVVLLHGGIGDSRKWVHQLEHLSDRFSLHAWDAPGAGASDDPDEHIFRLPDYADSLAGFIHELDIERAAGRPRDSSPMPHRRDRHARGHRAREQPRGAGRLQQRPDQLPDHPPRQPRNHVAGLA